MNLATCSEISNEMLSLLYRFGLPNSAIAMLQGLGGGKLGEAILGCREEGIQTLIQQSQLHELSAALIIAVYTQFPESIEWILEYHQDGSLDNSIREALLSATSIGRLDEFKVLYKKANIPLEALNQALLIAAVARKGNIVEFILEQAKANSQQVAIDPAARYITGVLYDGTLEEQERREYTAIADTLRTYQEASIREEIITPGIREEQSIEALMRTSVINPSRNNVEFLL